MKTIKLTPKQVIDIYESIKKELDKGKIDIDKEHIKIIEVDGVIEAEIIDIKNCPVFTTGSNKIKYIKSPL